MSSSTDTLSQETVRPFKEMKISRETITKAIPSTASVSDKKKNSKEGHLASYWARESAEHYVQISRSYSARYQNALPRLKSSEVEVGSLLGKGGFGDVFEIKSFPLLASNEQEDKDQRSSREFLKKHVHREATGDCRYALKRLRQSIVDDDEMFTMAAMDLAVEAKVLCSVFHPNIIKLRGVCSEGEAGFRKRKPEGFFLVLDRLDETLEKRINKWKEEGLVKKKGSTMSQLKGLFVSKKKFEDISNDKLKIIRDISSAMMYLHKRSIIYRDLKPENFGFDVRGDIKLFDFGLAKEITSCDKMEDGTYNLTGRTGSLRYMAPEVNMHKPYNLSADVYSFCVMLWEILTQKKAFQGFDVEKHAKLAVYGNYRPKISKSLPSQLQTLLEDGWSSNHYDRPSFDEIFKTFSEIISQQNGPRARPGLFTRRSTHHMLRQSQIMELVNFKQFAN